LEKVLDQKENMILALQESPWKFIKQDFQEILNFSNP
jgi:hypothetical protein